MLCVAATANLACEMDALPDEVVRVKAQGIENAVREWKPPPPDAQDLADSAGYVEKVSTSEMWRHVRLPFSLLVTSRELKRVLTLAHARPSLSFCTKSSTATDRCRNRSGMLYSRSSRSESAC